jgi:hypothetical protein
MYWWGGRPSGHLAVTHSMAACNSLFFLVLSRPALARERLQVSYKGRIFGIEVTKRSDLAMKRGGNALEDGSGW